MGNFCQSRLLVAKRALVPESLWLFLVDTANTVKPDEPMSCSVFPSYSDTCAICSVELTQVACLEDNLRAQKLKQRNNHEKLYLEKKIPLSPGCRYYILPSSWLAKWRSYIAASGKNISSSAEPDSLDNVIDLLKCDKHSRLLERPPDLICKRGAIFQKTSHTDGFTIITESDWKFFCEDWEWDEAHLGSSKDELNDELESRGPIIKTVPEVCEECVGEKESHKLVQRLQYSNEDICVYFVRGKEVPKSILEASQAISESDRHISKRSKKHRVAIL
ncbi:Ubiquitin carboxyl-terminal hydrolase [Thalictrum thalictroides]|uniref:Ubiquitin carboxyl-terminal hydrolase n=1 Tax=Thalictrum thalictroides TaxID=46969 RepID=A0A7J6WN42_THATH|nr:Ubiquitin carboxyl-terminal hydrolase [Thalictrum thalictroides]